MATSHNFLPPNLANFPKRPLAIPFFSPLPNGENLPKKNPGKKSIKRGKSGQISIFEF
jgi:hypothetical protein